MEEEDRVILVDKSDNILGTCEKMKAHREGRLHRAFSIFIFNSDGRLLLQRRALDKYHSAGLWTNTCCSHPREDETIELAAHRRLREEFGFDCNIHKLLEFNYKIKLSNDLYENEYDHVFVGEFNGIPKPSGNEISAWLWEKTDIIIKDIHKNPYKYTYWFQHILGNVVEYMKQLSLEG